MNVRRFPVLLLLCLGILTSSAFAASPNVVISQVYGGGGSGVTGTAYTNDYVELYNSSSAAVSIAGYSLQYGSSTGVFGGTGSIFVFPAGTTIGAGKYLLVKLGTAGTAGAALTPDFTSTGLNMAAGSGKVALANIGVSLGCGATATPCTLPDTRIIDVVAWGASNNGEGGTTVNNGTGLDSTKGAVRKAAGCQDPDHNNADFTVNTVATGLVPRNSASPANTTCTVVVPPSNNAPAITAPANPIATVNQDAAPFTVALTGSDDGGVYVWSAAAGSGVSNVTVSGGQGTANATFTVTLQGGFSGTASFTARLSDNVNAIVNQAVNITVTATPLPPVIPDHIVISQVYGGGGNAGAPFNRDFVELYNPTASAISVTGWSIQYASSTGSGWGGNSQPLAGTIGAGQYFLITLASGAVGASIPPANVEGEINMSGTNGKIALVRNGDPLSGNCPMSDADLVDFVGYGSADCGEGGTKAPAPSNTTSLFRKNGGSQDSQNNNLDFVTGTPNPRQTAPIAESGPAITGTDPFTNGSNAPRDANIVLNFSEAVTIDTAAAWFTITCATTGIHNDATVGGSAKSWTIVPNTNFLAGEQCSVTIFRNFIHDVDLNDADPNSDTLAADYTWSFTVATGALPSYPASIHLSMGNPSGAAADEAQPNNYLMEKPEFALSYNRDRGTPNWVSWHLATEWTGSLARVDTFRADPAVPPVWYRVLATDYFSSGFDRGHMTPNADRDPETSMPINQATFLMSNMVPQAPDNNQGPWANMENYLRTLMPTSELYIVSGPNGIGGTGSNGFATTIAGGHVTVPSSTWKVALVVPRGSSPSNVQASARTIAVIMPNVQGIRNNAWESYIVSVDAVEALTGYDFFANLPDAVENSVEAGINGVNPPGVADQSVTTTEDNATTFNLNAVSSTGGPLTYTIVTTPTHGTLSGTAGAQTYTPAPDYSGSDSFTFRVSDGTRTSGTATATITIYDVNDAPTAADDAVTTDEDAALTFAAASLTGNDNAGPANESTQTLTVTEVTATAATHGTVSISGGNITYTPAPNYNGAASFGYRVCDNGADSLCAAAAVNVTVNAMNDAPTAVVIAPASSNEGSAVSASAVVDDLDDSTFTYAWMVTKNGTPFVTGSDTTFSFTPDDNGSYAVSLTVSDPHGATGTASQTVAVANLAPAITTVAGPTTAISLGTAATISVSYTDAGAADTHTAVFTWDDGTSSTVSCAAGVCTGARTYAATGTYGVSISVSDDDGATVSTSFHYVIVANTSSSQITGGGWITTASGKGTFSFSAKYAAGTPSGTLSFRAGTVDITSTSFEWIVVAGQNAQAKGTAGSYSYLLTIVDADNGGANDKFRIRIWETASGTTVFDNVAGASDDLDAANPQLLGGGNVTIHKTK